MKLIELKAFGTYAAVRPTPETLERLADWAEDNGLKLEDDLHVTLLYSRVVKIVEVKPTIYSAIPLSATPLGTAALVVHLFCPELSGRHTELIAQGHTHDYPNFDCHMTLIKKHSGVLPKGLTKLPTLQFSGEYAESLSD